ncbi:MAG: hypothetical protein LBM61_06875 [Prevotellaceae bacterium]|jgi:hypothetical protein|nr:hypothetical protein [Prevotellaceae bacterium]
MIHFKWMLVAAVAMAMVMASCSKEDEGMTEGNKAVLFKLSHGQSVTRAVGKHVPNATPTATNLADASIYFVDANYQIAKVVTIDFTNKTAKYDENTGKVGLTTLTDGTLITNVPTTAITTCVVGNLSKANVTEAYSYPIVGENLRDKLKMTVESQYDPEHKGVAKVTFFGEDEIHASAGNPVTYSSNIKVKPIVARIEIGSISGNRMWLPSKTHDDSAKQPTDTLAGVQSFTLAGIYINNYYKDMSIVGTKTSNHISWEQTGKYYSTTGEGKYANLQGILCDDASSALVIQNTGIASNITNAAPYTYAPIATATTTATDANADVWGYNLLAPTFTNAAQAHIIVHLKDLVAIDGTAGGDQNAYKGDKWLTVGKIFKNKGAEPAELITSLEPGYIYRIINLSFGVKGTGSGGNPDPNPSGGGGDGGGGDDPTPNPEMTTVNVTVEATFIDWTDEDVDYMY